MVLTETTRQRDSYDWLTHSQEGAGELRSRDETVVVAVVVFKAGPNIDPVVFVIQYDVTLDLTNTLDCTFVSRLKNTYSKTNFQKFKKSRESENYYTGAWQKGQAKIPELSLIVVQIKIRNFRTWAYCGANRLFKILIRSRI